MDIEEAKRLLAFVLNYTSTAILRSVAAQAYYILTALTIRCLLSASWFPGATREGNREAGAETLQIRRCPRNCKRLAKLNTSLGARPGRPAKLQPASQETCRGANDYQRRRALGCVCDP